MRRGFSLRTTWEVSGSSVSGTTFGELSELVEDVEWNVATEDMVVKAAMAIISGNDSRPGSAGKSYEGEGEGSE